jgi:hypothetical protein
MVSVFLPPTYSFEQADDNKSLDDLARKQSIFPNGRLSCMAVNKLLYEGDVKSLVSSVNLSFHYKVANTFK